MVLLILIAAVIALAFILISLFLFFALFVGYPNRAAVLTHCGMCEKELGDQRVGNFCGHCYPISVGAL